MTVQSYMPAFVEGKKEGMDALASAILGELNAYASEHMDQPPPAPELYRRLIELCQTAKKGEPRTVHIVFKDGEIEAAYSAKPLAEAKVQKLQEDPYLAPVMIVDCEVHDEVYEVNS